MTPSQLIVVFVSAACFVIDVLRSANTFIYCNRLCSIQGSLPWRFLSMLTFFIKMPCPSYEKVPGQPSQAYIVRNILGMIRAEPKFCPKTEIGPISSNTKFCKNRSTGSKEIF